MMRVVRALLYALFAASAPRLAYAAAPSNSTVAAKAVRTPPAHTEETAEPSPPPAVRLTIDAPTTRGPWTMRVVNQGDVPVRIVADARLLTLDVQPRSARTPTRCELPADMRPDGDLQRTLVVPPGRSYSERFEPRLYCLGGNKLEALAPQAIVVARLGWVGAMSSRSTEPLEVSPIDGIEPSIAPQKWIESPPISLPDEPSAWMADAPAPTSNVAADVPRLSLDGPVAVDAEMSNDISIPVTLRNDGTHAVVVRFRPEALSFDLIGPEGVEQCRWPVMPSAELREAFTAIPAGQSELLSVTLSSYCTGQGLQQPGLLVVRPRLDTSNSSGASVGLRAFEGQLIAKRPTVVRLHRGTAPRVRSNPRLDP